MSSVEVGPLPCHCCVGLIIDGAATANLSPRDARRVAAELLAAATRLEA